ncbi:MAG: FkbM family methyltransferase [Flavobacteriales bacterium]|nr:FkbM family methyltransferase [Flavobacteriales bacterium]MCC6938063.1 FkbM family methyltransferase [Flavobacteriales bacterium]
MKKIIWGLLGLTAGRRSMQGLYEFLLDVALHGMNYGRGGDFRTDGELDLLHYIKKKLGPNDKAIVFDVGANIGEYSVALADFFGKGSTVHAFEPSKDTHAKLMKTLGGHTNPSSGVVVAHNTGFSDAVGTLRLYRNPERHTLASVYNRDLEHFNITMDEVEEIQLTTVDQFCADHRIERLHFLKIDIEGHELSALKGAERMIREGRIDHIQFEFGGANVDSRTYFRDFYSLLKDKFTLYRIVRNGLRPIPYYKEAYEQFQTINYLAERKG